MFEYVTSSDIANSAMMLKSGFDGTIVIVEGITDRRLFGKFMDKKRTNIIIAYSKNNVVNSVKTLYNERDMQSVIGLTDADMDILAGKHRKPPTFITDTRDSENMMLRSSAFDYVMEEYGDPEKMKRYTERYGDILDAVLDAAYPIGCLMYISYVNGFKLSFKDLDFEYFIDRRSLRCDVDRLIEEVLSHSRNDIGLEPDTLYNILTNEKQHDRWAVCRGHDLMSVLAFGLRNIFGGSNCRNITGEQIGGSFRLSYNEDDLTETKLFRDTEDWCTANGLSLWNIRD